MEIRERPEIYQGMPIHEQGSFGPESADEVARVDEAFQRGIPMVVYELAQGVLDNENGDPPGRICVLRQNGDLEIWNGNTVSNKEGAQVCRMLFKHNGNGLPPEYTTIILHQSSKDDVLGGHGRGTTVALTVLEKNGITASIESYAQGYKWTGQTSLQPTTTGATSTLHVDGVFEEPAKPGQKTEIALHLNGATSDKMCKQLSLLPQYLLQANSKFPGARLVDYRPEPGQKTPFTVSLHGGYVMCVDEMVKNFNARGEEFSPWYQVFVDGLRIDADSMGKSILPWLIMGLRKAPSPMTVARGESSTEIVAHHLFAPISYAVRQLEDEDLLTKLIVIAGKSNGKAFLEFGDLTGVGLNVLLSANTARLTRQIWKTNFNNLPITDNTNLAAELGFGKEEFIAVDIGFFKFLRDAGVATVHQRASEHFRRQFSLDVLHLPALKAETRFEWLVDQVVRADGEFSIDTFDGKTALHITLPGVPEDAMAFKGNTEQSTGKMVQYCAIASEMSRETQFNAFFINRGVKYMIDVKVRGDATGEARYRTEVTLEERPIAENDLQFQKEHTHVFLTGEGINRLFDNGTLNQLMRSFLAAVEAVQQKLARARRFTSGIKNIGKSDGGQYFPSISSGMEIQQPPLVRSVDPVLAELTRSEVPPGYYLLAIRDRFAIDPDNQTARWFGTRNWEKMQLPEGISKESGVIPITFEALSGYRELPVRYGYKIVAFKGDPSASVEIFCDPRLNVYTAMGTAQELTIYIKVNDRRLHQFQKPNTSEVDNSMICISDLADHWQELLQQIQRFGQKNKMRAIYEAWANQFVYDSNPAITTKIRGRDKMALAASILNIAEGTCTFNASGIALLARAAGLASRISEVYVIGEGNQGLHAIAEIFVGDRWIPVEISQNRIRTPGETFNTGLEAGLGILNGIDYRHGGDSPTASSVRVAILLALLGLNGAVWDAAHEKYTGRPHDHLGAIAEYLPKLRNDAPNAQIPSKTAQPQPTAANTVSGPSRTSIPVQPIPSSSIKLQNDKEKRASLPSQSAEPVIPKKDHAISCGAVQGIRNAEELKRTVDTMCK